MRITSDSLIRTIMKTGYKTVAKPLVIYYLPNDCNRSRICVRISRKHGTAVVRNTIKRHIREFFRRNPDKPVDIVIIVSGKFEVVDHDIINRLLQDANIK